MPRRWSVPLDLVLRPIASSDVFGAGALFAAAGRTRGFTKPRFGNVLLGSAKSTVALGERSALMYEVVLRSHDREEIRVTDHDPRPAGYVVINGQKWEIVAEEEASNADAVRRYIVAPVAAGRGP
jgi:hypothetical protein